MKIALEIIFAVWAACGWILFLRFFGRVVELEKQIERNVRLFREFESEKRRMGESCLAIFDLYGRLRWFAFLVIWLLLLVVVYLWKKGGFKFQ